MKADAKTRWRLYFVSILFFLAGLPPVRGTESGLQEHALAIAYTESDYRGIAWPIFEDGRYDLFAGFGLPNDTMASIRIAPGWGVTLYEYAGFEGDQVTFTEDEPDLDLWKDSVSSLTVTKIAGRALPADGKTLDEYLEDSGRYRGPYPEADILVRIEALTPEQKEKIKDFQDQWEWHWYGTTTDDERIAKGGELLELFSALGVKTNPWKNNTFAQRLNNFYDWEKSWSVWKTACMALNVENTQTKTWQDAFEREQEARKDEGSGVD